MHTDEDPAQSRGYRQLLCAILCLAWKDAHGRDSKARTEAIHWLGSAGAAYICDELGLPVDTLRARLGG